MQQFLVLFREPDGRKDPHTPEANVDHGSTDRNRKVTTEEERVEAAPTKVSIVSPFPPEDKFPNDPEAEKLAQHRQNWNRWSEQMNSENRIAGGMPLTLSGRVLTPSVTEGPYQTVSKSITEGPHKVGEENVRRTGSLQNVSRPTEKSNVCPSDKEPPVLSDVGGYLLINARDMDEATSLMQDCPIFEFGGYAEIREGMMLPGAASLPGTGPAASGARPPAAPSLQEQNRSIVRRFNTAYIQDGDISAFHEIIDPSVINHTAPAGFSNGADGMLDVIELFRKALTGLEVKILRQVAEDDIVVTHKNFHATHTGPLLGIPPSGQAITITIIDIVRLRNGKYIEHWGIRDMSGLRPAH